VNEEDRLLAQAQQAMEVNRKSDATLRRHPAD
jgi:hypothetical protein